MADADHPGPINDAHSMCIAALGLSVAGKAPASIAFWIALTAWVSICCRNSKPSHCSVMRGTEWSTNINWKNAGCSWENW